MVVRLVQVVKLRLIKKGRGPVNSHSLRETNRTRVYVHTRVHEIEDDKLSITRSISVAQTDN